MTRVAITGASSFTGVWIAREFKHQGWDVVALCSRPADEYRGLTASRISLLREALPVVFNVDAQKGTMVQWIRENKPEVWVHHHHWMENFRSPDYDYQKSMAVGIHPLVPIMQALVEVKCKGIIFSGTFFEPGEGGNPLGYPATPYAKSKRAVWEVISNLAKQWEMPLSKMVIPNPVGPYENLDRLIPGILQKARAGEVLNLRNPESISDYLPVQTLAKLYVHLAKDLLEGKVSESRPSGWIGSVADWVRRINEEMIKPHLSINPCKVELAPRESWPAPTSFVNRDRQSIVWEDFFEDFAKSLV